MKFMKLIAKLASSKVFCFVYFILIWICVLVPFIIYTILYSNQVMYIIITILIITISPFLYQPLNVSALFQRLFKQYRKKRFGCYPHWTVVDRAGDFGRSRNEAGRMRILFTSFENSGNNY